MFLGILLNLFHSQDLKEAILLIELHVNEEKV